MAWRYGRYNIHFVINNKSKNFASIVSDDNDSEIQPNEFDGNIDNHSSTVDIDDKCDQIDDKKVIKKILTRIETLTDK